MKISAGNQYLFLFSHVQASFTHGIVLRKPCSSNTPRYCVILNRAHAAPNHMRARQGPQPRSAPHTQPVSPPFLCGTRVTCSHLRQTMATVSFPYHSPKGFHSLGVPCLLSPPLANLWLCLSNASQRLLPTFHAAVHSEIPANTSLLGCSHVFLRVPLCVLLCSATGTLASALCPLVGPCPLVALPAQKHAFRP